MADKQQNSTTTVHSNMFSKGMSRDLNESFVGEGMYVHARNAVNNSHNGEVGVLGNEPSLLKCLTLSYTLIGSIPVSGGRSVLFSTNDSISEIGIYDPSKCGSSDAYTVLITDISGCLNFKKSNLITGQSRRTFDCSEKIYWSDGGLNPDRVLDINNIPWKQTCVYSGDCLTCTPDTPLTIDCEKLRLASLLSIPCLKLRKAKGSGVLKNGTYQVAVAYVVNEIRVTDYLMTSNPVSIFSHSGTAGAIELSISSADSDFDDMQVVVISTVNGQTVAKDLGIFSTKQQTIYIDSAEDTLLTVPLRLIPLQTPSYEKSDAIFSVGDYLLRTGIYTKPDFNYQPLANQIKARWTSVQYPADYYSKGGENVGYMRDENYVFFIRWIYNTGDKSASYFISGHGNTSNTNGSNLPIGISTNLGDGGTVVAEGEMGYAESAEKYPANNPAVWGALCGKPIRLHKFPDNVVDPHYSNDGTTVNVLGVRFENIKHPLDNSGNPIMSIVGYEILRGNREGNKTVVAKGMLNNMRSYKIPGTTQEGLFQNYPYNDLNSDPYLDSSAQSYKKDVASFHSPDTSFQHPSIGAGELKLYGEISGESVGKFETPHQHPHFKMLTEFTKFISDFVGIMSAISLFDGSVSITGTEDLPFSQTLGPLPPFPTAPQALLGVSSGGPIDGGVSFFLQVAAWTAQFIARAAIAAVNASIIEKKILDIFSSLVPYRQYAAQYNSHGFYNKWNPKRSSVSLSDYGYVASNVQNFGNYRVNNLYRDGYVILKLDSNIPDASGDRSRVIGRPGENSLTSPISSLYGALKVILPGQYGQIENIKQLGISNCVHETTPTTTSRMSTPVLFGGDTYIHRYTEKNPFFFFNDWLVGQPDDFQYDYRNYINVPKPKFWVDNRKLYGGILSDLGDTRSLYGASNSTFYVKEGNFFLFCNGVRDFFVESEVNTGYRDWEDGKRFYDPYGFSDTSLIFRSDVIKNPSLFKYDYSLSVSRFYNQYSTAGEVLPRSFDPAKAESCYSHYPRRVVYSLPQTEEQKRDNWRSFLVDNYKDFPSEVTSVKPVNKSGAIIFMKEYAPVMFNGVDTLQTDAGTKITVGDGGLFNQALQSVTSTDRVDFYGSCQNRYSVINTPAGVVWVSAITGKVFLFSGGTNILSDSGMKWWFSQNLPFKLTQQFPDYPYLDNPVNGIGVQATYDTTNDILYITKRDYILREGAQVTHSNGVFYALRQGNPVNPGRELIRPRAISLCDNAYFEDVSWTASYDMKTKSWISMHDWHPEMIIPSVNHFVTAKRTCGSDSTVLWEHNRRTDSFCNFYGTDYPFEIEYISNGGGSVEILKNVEYLLECYKYSQNGQDRYHLLDYNFDRAIIRNSEQISALLRLNLKTKGNPVEDLKYPALDSTGTYYDIQYTKEEQKYRFNQFWDITKDRGEFSSSENILVETANNGYSWSINPNSVDTNKPVFQRKKFRHILNRILLRRNNCGAVKMNLKLVNTKNQISQR